MLVGQWWPLYGVCLPSQHFSALDSMQEWQAWLSRTFIQDFVFDHKSSVIFQAMEKPWTSSVTVCLVLLYQAPYTRHPFMEMRRGEEISRDSNPMKIEMSSVFLGVC